MKKLYFSAIAAVGSLALHAQSISPGAIYGASNVSQSGSVSLEWILGSINAFPNLSVLPVKLIRFEGKLTPEGHARLEWETAEEYNNAGFQILKSIDGKVFEMIGKVDGSVNSQTRKVYHFTDQQLTTTSYYRLRQVDTDGKFTLSKIVSIVPENESLERFIAFPNPSPNAKITVNFPERTGAVSVTNIHGAIIRKIANPQDQETIDLPATGIYLLSIECAAGTKTIRIARE